MTSARLPVTLALVAYHKADVIGLVIESAANGSVPPDLVVVSDDGSTDGTPDVAEDACRRVGLPCRIVRHQRVGLYRIQTMRNTVASEALDGVIVLSDSDCVIGPLMLETHREIHERHPSAVGTGTRFEYLAGTSGDFTSQYSTLEFAHCGHANYLVPYGANMSFRKSLWRELGGFDRAYEGKYGYEDHEFVMRAELSGATIQSDPAAYVHHCPHDTVFGNRNSMSNVELFHRQFGRDGYGEERTFIREVALPWYWRGHRKAPLLGTDRLELDAWGALPGFHLPLHLRAVVDHDVLTAPVVRLLEEWSPDTHDAVRGLLGALQNRVLHAAPAHHLFAKLRWLIDNHPDRTAQLRRELNDWLDWSQHLSPLPMPQPAAKSATPSRQPRAATPAFMSRANESA